MRDLDRPGTGVTFTPALSQAYAEGATVSTPGTGITFTPALDSAHASGSSVTGSGNPLAALDPSAGAQVTPRLIGRLEIAYTDGSSETVVTNRDWRAAFGAAVTDHWFGGTDYDARREPADSADLSDAAKRRDGTRRRLAQRGDRPAAEPDHEAGRPHRGAGEGPAHVHAGEADEPAAGRVGVRLRPELRGLARAAPARRDPRGHDREDAAGARR